MQDATQNAARRRRGWWSSALLGAASACHQPYAEGDTGVAALTSSQPSTSHTASDGEDSIDGTSTAMPTDVPSRPVPPPFELPDGCGDGVVVPGQYDCFVPIALNYFAEQLSHSFREFERTDIDDDGTDELILTTGFSWGNPLHVLYWADGELRAGPPLLTFDDSIQVDARWDWDGDGRRDLSALGGYQGVWSYPYLGGKDFGEARLEYTLDPALPLNTPGVLIDVDLDGFPEILVSEQYDYLEQMNPANRLVLRKRVEGVWQQVGDAVDFGPSGWLSSSVQADFDGDGDLDIAINDAFTAYDPFPSGYDPVWYRVGIFLTDSVSGTLDLHGWFPLGGLAVDYGRMWAEDVDLDGILDLVMPGTTRWGDQGRELPLVVKGLGLGDFAVGSFVEFDEPLAQRCVPKTRGDLDGDGITEWLVDAGYSTWLLNRDLSLAASAPVVAPRSVDDGWFSNVDGVGDLNGDGVDDYLGFVNLIAGQGPGHGEKYIMISAP